MVLLVDGDIAIYKAAYINEGLVDWEYGADAYVWTDRAKAELDIQNNLAWLLAESGCDSIMIALSSPDNFRNHVDPSYKQNRAALKRPMLLEHLRGFLEQAYDCIALPRLEADDVMGVLATTTPGKYLICSVDKDLRQIPGEHMHMATLARYTVTPEDGHRYWLEQTLTGDPTDGYPGCPNIGKARARKLLDAKVALVPIYTEVTRGKNKGEIRVTYKEVPTKIPWMTVLSTYESKGLPQSYALTQARLAKILTADLYRHGKPCCAITGEALI